MEIRIELNVELPFWVRLNFPSDIYYLDIVGERLEFNLENDIWELYSAERDTRCALHVRIPEYYYYQPRIQEILYNQERFKFSKRKTSTIISQVFTFSESIERAGLEHYIYDKIAELRRRFFRNVNLFISYYKEQFCPELPNREPGMEIEELTWFLFMKNVEHNIHVNNEFLFIKIGKPEDIDSPYPYYIVRQEEADKFRGRLTNRPKLNYKKYLWKNAMTNFASNDYFLASIFCKAAAEAYFKEFLILLRFIKLFFFFFLQLNTQQNLSKAFIDDGFSHHFIKIKELFSSRIQVADFEDLKYISDIRNEYLHLQRRREPDLDRFQRGLHVAANLFSII